MAERYLHRNVGLNYTASLAMAVPHEPEALDEIQLAEVVERSAELAREQRRTNLERVRDEHRRRAEWHAAQLRFHERETQRLNRRLTV